MENKLYEKLQTILSGDLPYLRNKEVYIFGAGNTAVLFQNGLKRIESENLFSISGYCDNNKEKWGKEFCGKKVVGLDELCGKENPFVLICSVQTQVQNAVKQQLDELHIPNMNMETFLLKSHKEKALGTFSLLSDEKSQETYVHLTDCRVNNLEVEEEYFSENQYAAVMPFKGAKPNEVFIDCGAFVGDSIEKYIWERDGVFKKIIAFEPDTTNLNAFNFRLERLKKEWNFDDGKIKVYPYGIGKETMNVTIQRNDNNNGLGTHLKETWNNEVDMEMGGGTKIVALDEFIEEPYSFLKADIESYEYDMLLGAKNGIQKYKPNIAVCIYHNSVDFFDIPLLLKEILPEYKFALRHHSPTLSETVLYAYV